MGKRRCGQKRKMAWADVWVDNGAVIRRMNGGAGGHAISRTNKLPVSYTADTLILLFSVQFWFSKTKYTRRKPQLLIDYLLSITFSGSSRL